EAQLLLKPLTKTSSAGQQGLQIMSIYRLLQLIILSSVFALSGHISYGQTTGDYRTRAAGNWNNNGTWQRYNGTAWVNATDYPGEAAGTGAVAILNNVTLNVNPANSLGSLSIQANLTPNNSDRALSYSGRAVSIFRNTQSFKQ
ncbi:MAG: hypothetical protein MZV63_40960, partial [Marinilabiliales bacterium]|nr:hypothetical protein [Marinilabiliales bacterium]